MKLNYKVKQCLRHLSEFIMSSPPSSVTQQSESSVSTVVSNKEKHHHMFMSYWDLLGEDIYHKLWQLKAEGIHHAADKAINLQYEFTFNKDFKGNILVPKKGDESISEFILSGIFQIDAWYFFMTLDGKWNANNMIGTHFDQVKPSCHLLPVQHDSDFAFSWMISLPS